MLTRTTELAIQALLIIGFDTGGEPVTPKRIADRLACSPTYLSKILGQLARAGILTAVRGARGGVFLGRKPDKIRLLDVVEACQGVILGSFCASPADGLKPCAFHRSMRELHDNTVTILGRWTLADLLASPARCADNDPRTRCRMFFEGCEQHVAPDQLVTLGPKPSPDGARPARASGARAPAISSRPR